MAIRYEDLRLATYNETRSLKAAEEPKTVRYRIYEVAVVVRCVDQPKYRRQLSAFYS